jgi:UDP-3-O-[3-hydroxymyristoyl] glucosamine N-acyltransferase
MAEMTVSQLAQRLGGELSGEGGRVLRGVGTLESAQSDEVAFLANVRYEKLMETTSAGAIIVAGNYAGPGECLIRCGDPYYAFREAMVAFYGFRAHPFEGIDPRASIDRTASVDPTARVSPFVTIAAACRIGPGTVIYPGVYVGAGSQVGRDCILYPNVTLYDGTVLHDRVTIHAGSSIGHDGFGYATHKGADGVVRHEKIPAGGYVELEDDVEIGACCAIDRATMGPTVIGAGTKFSNLVAIGHGTKMGQHCLMVAQAGIAGSVTVGNYCVFAGQAGVVGHIKIGDGAKIGAQAGVTNDVPAGQEVLGSPAIPLPQMRRVVANTLQLPEMRMTIKKLAREVEELKRRLDGKGENGAGPDEKK